MHLTIFQTCSCNWKMIDIQEFLMRFSLVSFVLYFIRRLRKTLHMSIVSPPTPSPSPSSPPSPSSLHWLGPWIFLEKEKPFSKLEKSKKTRNDHPTNDYKDDQNPDIDEDARRSTNSRKRPAKLVVPSFVPCLDFGEVGKKFDKTEFETEGRNYSVASRKGRRQVMEDNQGAMLDILGDPKQAFFVVIDGHGGKAAAEYVAENLGKNIVKELEGVERKEGKHIEVAIREGYSRTDQQFLKLGENGGACVASALLKDEELHVSNVGDCRVVLSRNGVAVRLTNDHRLSREDERARVETAGGFVYCHNGVWRVNGSLAVSRAFGDNYLKEWIISEPDVVKLPLTSDCEFLMMASDGLWDKVSDQEAVDVVSKEKSSILACKKLVDMSARRGNLDDITVMVINLQSFLGSN
ncbi:probable protein phosphatase 2C 2 [Lycium barbarum]|uniref:probable protein phosphatase 2C 2 n=1 Tax=Lycium barbarum TaxID=112863 RepID=UPI00293EF513|nr:probable protein phosphatase 2C 2 [Lycium barbarum]